MVKGKGIVRYLNCIEKGQIKAGYKLVVKSGNLDLEFYVNDNGTLDWANIFTERALERNGIQGDLDNLNYEKILSGKKWYIKERKVN